MQLFINTRGSMLKKAGERFVVSSNGRQHEFSAKKLSSLVVSTSVCLTSDAVQLANEHKIDIVFLNKSGFPASRVWQTRMGSTANIRIAQLHASLGPTGLAYAHGWILKKLDNQITFLTELKQRRLAKAESLLGSLRQLNENCARLKDLVLEKTDFDSQQQRNDLCASIRGLEGTSGRIYFRAISELLPDKHQFSTRSRRPAHDAFNATLNYSYGVLYSRIEKALILAGLDPFIGFFHANRYGQPSLVFDLIEPFRIIGERTTTLLFTGKRVKDDWFRDVPGGVELAPDGRAALIESLNSRLEKTVRFPTQKQPAKPGPPKTRNIKLRETIRHEAHQLANGLLNRNDLPSVINTNDLFGEPAVK